MNELNVLLHMLVPPVKDYTFEGLLIWAIEVIIRALAFSFVLWILYKVDFYIKIGFGKKDK